MIQTESITIGGHQFIRTYSDNGFMIHGGFPEADYTEAIDPAGIGRTYVETDIPIDQSDDDSDDEYAEAGRIMMGVE